jgi:[amino group carrier protein]-L-2-aminoadipate 6-kinase
MLIIKVGGGKNINWKHVCADLAVLARSEPVVLVHGASVKRDEVAQKLGITTRYLTSPSGQVGVYTDKSAIEVMSMVYAGLVNKQVVAMLQQAGVNAVGLSGADGRIWEGKRKTNLIGVENGKNKLIRDTYTGKVEQVNTDLLKLLIKHDYLPVVTQPAISFEGDLINTDNDRNIAVMARDLACTKLVVLFEAPGLLQNADDETSLIKKVKRTEIDLVMYQVSGRMKKKVLGAKEALGFGVVEIYWGDARIKNPVMSALAGNGTVIS